MDHPLRRPEEILAYRPLKRILAARSKSLWTVSPRDNALTAMRLMAEKDIGIVVVTEHGAIAGILSERDCVRAACACREVSRTYTGSGHHGPRCHQS